jgi:nitroreductase
LRAGFSAPSASNTRPWHFIVIRDPQALDAVTKAHPYAQMLPQAGCGILVCGDADRNPMEGYLAEDCSAAMENMLLAAHALGLGAVWLGLYPREERVKVIKGLFNIPENVLPMGLMAVGVPAESKDAPDRFDGTMVHLEKW